MKFQQLAMGACIATMKVYASDLTGQKMSYEGAVTKLEALGNVDFADKEEVSVG